MRCVPIPPLFRLVRPPACTNALRSSPPRPCALLFGLITAMFLSACTTAPQTTDLTAQTPPASATAATSPTAAAAPPTEPADGAAALPTSTPAGAPATEVPAPSAPDLSAVSVNLEPMIENLEQPLFVTHAGDGSGRVFIVEKVGRIRIVQDGTLLDTPFLDISDKVSLSSEQGLLGLAFTPDYPTSGKFYVNYTNQIGDTVIARYAVSADDPNQADSASELPILQLDQPAGQP